MVLVSLLLLGYSISETPPLLPVPDPCCLATTGSSSQESESMDGLATQTHGMASYHPLSPSLLPPFLYRVSNILGYLPQDLVGHNSYDYFHPDDMQKMIQLHHEGMLPCRHDNSCHGNLISLSPPLAMKQRSPMPTVHYRFLSKDKKWVWLAMKAFSFVNPFSHQVEYVVCTNVVHTRLVIVIIIQSYFSNCMLDQVQEVRISRNSLRKQVKQVNQLQRPVLRHQLEEINHSCLILTGSKGRLIQRVHQLLPLPLNPSLIRVSRLVLLLNQLIPRYKRMLSPLRNWSMTTSK